MSREKLLPQLIMLTLAWLVMMLGSYFSSWVLLPDVILLVLLAIQLHQRVPISWLLVLPFVLLCDVASALPLGFHGVYYSAVLLLLLPLGLLWSIISTLAQLALVLFAATLLVLLKWLMIYIVTAEPVASGWWLTVLGNLICWPLVLWFVSVASPPEVKDESL